MEKAKDTCNSELFHRSDRSILSIRVLMIRLKDFEVWAIETEEKISMEVDAKVQ